MRRAFGSALPASGLSGSPAPVIGIQAQHDAAQQNRLACGPPQALGAQRAALRERREQRDADAAGRVAERIDWDVLPGSGSVGATELPVVHVDVVRALAAGHVERAVGAEGEAAHRMARKLMGKPVEQDLLGRLHRPGRRCVEP